MSHVLGDRLIIFSLTTLLPGIGNRHTNDYLKRKRMEVCDGLEDRSSNSCFILFALCGFNQLTVPLAVYLLGTRTQR